MAAEAVIALTRPAQRRRYVSIVPLADVLLILLVFFMVTSTWADLDMMPVLADAPGAAQAEGGASSVLFIRLGPDGLTRVQGQTRDSAALDALIRARVADNPRTAVMILPSDRAPVQGLVSLLDTAAAAGASPVRVLRLEAER